MTYEVLKLATLASLLLQHVGCHLLGDEKSELDWEDEPGDGFLDGEEIEALDMRLLQVGQSWAVNPDMLDWQTAVGLADSLAVPPPVVEIFWKPPPRLAANASQEKKPSADFWWLAPGTKEKSQCRGGLQSLMRNCGEQVAGLAVISACTAVLAYFCLWLGGRERPRRAEDVATRQGWGSLDASVAAWQTALATGRCDFLTPPLPRLLLVQLACWTSFGTLAACFADMVLEDQCARRGLLGPDCLASREASGAATASLASLSLLLAVPVLATLPFMAHLCDVLGRKPLLMAANLQGMAFYSLLALRGTGDLVTFGVVALVLAGGVFVADTAASAAICDLSEGAGEVVRVRLLSYVQAPAWLGQLLGPLMGSRLGAAIGPQRAFLLPAIISGMLFALVMAGLPETLSSKSRKRFAWQEAQIFGTLRRLQHPRCLVAGLGLICAEVGTSAGVATWPGFLRRSFDWPDGRIAAFQALFSLGNVAVLLFLLPRLVPVSGPRRILLSSACCTMLLWALHMLAVTSWQIWLALCLGAFVCMLQPCIRAIVAQELGPQACGQAMSAPLLLQQAAHLVAAPLAQAVWGSLRQAQRQESSAYLMPMIAMAAAFLVFCYLPPRSASSEFTC